MSDLFKEILANAFTDTPETIQWLLKNDYILFGYKGRDSFLYYKNIEFKWLGKMAGGSKKLLVSNFDKGGNEFEL